MMNKNLIMIAVIILIVVTIFVIQNVQSDGITEKNINCIAEKSELYVTKTCGYCAAQKEMLGDDINKFKIIDCGEERDKCVEKGITKVPTWIINGKSYLGKKTFKELKELTGC